MINNSILKAINRTLMRIETKLVLLLFYTACLFWLFLRNGILATFGVHVISVSILASIHFGKEFLRIFFFPFLAVIVPVSHLRSTRYVKRFKNNVATEVVVVLGHSDWHKFISWIKPNYFTDELRALVDLLTAKKQDFSFFTEATEKDVNNLMKNPSVKEIYFFGHGDSHVFCLGTDELLFYCEFKGEQFKKEFVHQVHCGTKDGKSLIEYVVPKENRLDCFFFRKEINGPSIIKEFRRRKLAHEKRRSTVAT